MSRRTTQIRWSRELETHVRVMLRSHNDKDFLEAFVKATQQAIRDVEISLDRPVACLAKIRKVYLDRVRTTTICINIVTGELRACPEFIKAWVTCAADFGFLLLHERGHLILNYIVNTTIATPFEEDAIINVNAIPLSGSNLLTRFYATRAIQGHPVMLLLQSDVQMTAALLFANPDYQHGPWEEVQRWHRTAYDGANWWGSDWSPSESMKLIARWRDAIQAAKPKQASGQPNGGSAQGQPGGGQGSGDPGEGKGEGTPGQGSSAGQGQPGGEGGQPGGEGTPGGGVAGQKRKAEAHAGQAPSGDTTGSGEGKDSGDGENPLGHEAGNEAQKDSHKEGERTAQRYKSTHPEAFTPEGASTGEGHDVSFAAMHIPEEAGLCASDDLGNMTYLELTRPSSTGQGVTMTTLLTTRLGGSTTGTVMNTMAPSQLDEEDMVSLAMGHIPEVWAHETAPQEAEADLYLDFSGSMQSYWGLTLAVARELKFKVKHVEGFATGISEADLNAGGISVGGGTNLTPVLEKMEERRTECAVWVTDLGFHPSTYSDEATTQLNWLLGRSIKRLIILVPARDIELFSAEEYMNRYFGRLNAAARSCISIHPINSRGESA